jgi:hypothetical protein
LLTAVLLDDGDSGDWDGTVLSLEMGDLFGAKYLKRI